MTAPDKPTPGQIGLVETEIARWLWSLQRQPRLKGDPAITQGLCEQIASIIESGRFSVTGQGQEERGKPTAQGCGYKWYELKERLKKDPKLDPYDEVGIAMEIMEMES